MSRFKRIYLEITNSCNLRCDFCPQTKRQAAFMSVPDFRHILDQLKGCTDHLYFHVKGEPLLHPNLEQFLDISHEKGFKVNLTTNGTLLHRVGDMLMTKPALRQVNISLHSIVGNEDCPERGDYLKKVLSFTKEAMARTDILIALRLWNLDESNEVNLQRERNEGLLRAIERAFSLPFRIEEKTMPERGIKVADRVYVNQDYKFQWPDLMREDEGGAGFCYGLRSQAAILVDGTVVPCCLDGEGVINLGNIHQKSFAEILECDRAVRLTEGFARREAVEELCRKCGYRKRFG